MDSLTFEFYTPPIKDRHSILSHNKLKIPKNDAVPLEVGGDWKSEWHQEYKDLPALMKIYIGVDSEKDKQKILLAYPLPKSQLIILYDR